jgi:hypothetical protein
MTLFSNIAQLVVLIVRGHGGRFLGQMVGPGRLYEIGDENAEYKTRQCFYITRPESMEMRRICSYNYDYYAHKHEPEFKARLAKTRAKYEQKYFDTHHVWRYDRMGYKALLTQDFLQDLTSSINEMFFPGKNEINHVRERDAKFRGIVAVTGDPLFMSQFDINNRNVRGLALLFAAHYIEGGRGRVAFMDTEFN